MDFGFDFLASNYLYRVVFLRKNSKITRQIRLIPRDFKDSKDSRDSKGFQVILLLGISCFPLTLMHFLIVNTLFRSFVIRRLNQISYMIFSKNHVFLYCFHAQYILESYHDYLHIDGMHTD